MEESQDVGLWPIEGHREALDFCPFSGLLGIPASCAEWWLSRSFLVSQDEEHSCQPVCWTMGLPPCHPRKGDSDDKHKQRGAQADANI